MQRLFLSDRYPKSYALRRYAAVLLLLSAFIFMACFNLTRAINQIHQQTEDARQASNHYYLSNHIFALTHQMLGAKTQNEYQNKNIHLKQLLEEFEASFDSLVYHDESRSTPRHMSEEMQDLYLGGTPSLAFLFHKYIAHLKLLANKPWLKDANKEDLLTLRQLSQGELKDRLEEVVFLYEEEAVQSIHYLKKLQFIFFVLVFVLFLGALEFVFRPFLKNVTVFHKKFVSRYKKLYRQKKAAEMQSWNKSAFLKEMSHAIRTPLNGVIGTLELFQIGEVSHEQSEYIQTINKSSHALLNLVNNIIDFSRIETNSFKLDLAQFDAHKLVSDVIAFYQAMAEEKGIEIIVKFDMPLSSYLIGDKYCLQQVLSNLVSNAVRHTHHGYILVSVSCRAVGKSGVEMRVEVSDTGDGIPLETQKNVFHKFSSLQNTYLNKGEGVGLGLTISKRVIEMMDGEIAFVSDVDKGSSFWFEVPLSFGTLTKVSVEKDFNLKGANILIVDDIKANRDIIVGFAKSVEMNAVAAASAEEAIAAINNHVAQNIYFDLAIIDYHMPDMSGVELVRLMKKSKTMRKIPTIIASSSQESETTKRLEKIGVKGFLIKPLYIGDVLSMISILIQSIQRNKNVPFLTNHTVSEMMAGVDESRKTLPSKKDTSLLLDKRVLLVEDNEINRIVISAMIEKLGCKVTLAENGKQGLKKLKDQDYDLILTDCLMPEMDGFKMTSVIRTLEEKTKREMKIIALTASVLPGDREKCLSAGMDDYLSKPVNLEELRAVLEKYLC